jgi:acyl dehydratase
MFVDEISIAESGRRPLYYDDFAIGQEFITAARTITESDVMTFAGLSGDFNAIHTDATYAGKTIYGERIAHGYLGMIIAIGLFARLGVSDGSTIALLGLDDWRFVAPIRIGDTIRAHIKVGNKRITSDPSRGIIQRQFTVLNQNDTIVQSGTSMLLVSRKPPTIANNRQPPKEV